MEAFTDNHGGNLVLREFPMRMKMGERSDLYDSPWPSEKPRTRGSSGLAPLSIKVSPPPRPPLLGLCL
jgi:hypothetical protein